MSNDREGIRYQFEWYSALCVDNNVIWKMSAYYSSRDLCDGSMDTLENRWYISRKLRIEKNGERYSEFRYSLNFILCHPSFLEFHFKSMCTHLQKTWSSDKLIWRDLVIVFMIYFMYANNGFRKSCWSNGFS